MTAIRILSGWSFLMYMGLWCLATAFAGLSWFGIVESPATSDVARALRSDLAGCAAFFYCVCQYAKGQRL